MCLCLVLGCAGHNRYAQRLPTTETNRSFASPAVEPSEPANSSPDCVAAEQLDRPTTGVLSGAYLGTSYPSTELRFAIDSMPVAASPTTEQSSDKAVVQTDWVLPESTATNPSAADEASRPLSEVLPQPDSPALQRALSLREAIDTALMQNTDLVTARAGGPVASAARGVAATYPWNPSVQTDVSPYVRDRDGNLLAVKNHVTVMQTLELAHQPLHRRQVADAAWNQERSKIAQAEWTAVTAAMRSYFVVLYKKGLLDLARESAKLGDDMAGAVNRRFDAGLATPAERITANVAARRSRQRAELADVDYQAALQMLRVVLNTLPDEQIEPGSALEAYGWLSIEDVLDAGLAGPDEASAAGDEDDAIMRLAANRPDVAAARFGVSVAGANLDLARSNMTPNLSAGPSYERDESGTLFLGVAAQMDLPVWNTGCPLVQQRGMELQQQLITWRQTETRAASEARAAVSRYRRARRLWLQMSADRRVGGNELHDIHDAFENGQASIIEVLATKDNLILEQQTFLDLLNELSQASVDVVAALAIDPDRLIEAPSGAAPGTAKQE
jgi:outer membrane protein, heavy metal efflux system